MHRKNFLATLAGIPTIASAGFAATTPSPTKKLKTSLNAFSFNDPLLAGKMTISGTGVRNDFTIADPARRAEEVKLVKNWIEVAAKLGAPVLRIFAGNQKNEGISKETVTEWMLKDIRQCVDYGQQHGVVIGLQNHNDFIQTAHQVIDIIRQIDSEWLGLILDTGSYRVLNPYEEISTSLNYTVNWQIKEKIFVNGAEIDTDIEKIVGMIKASPYHGYLPIETLGQGDPKTKIRAMLAKLQNAIG